jgi:hypothetical protein
MNLSKHPARRSGAGALDVRAAVAAAGEGVGAGHSHTREQNLRNRELSHQMR